VLISLSTPVLLPVHVQHDSYDDKTNILDVNHTSTWLTKNSFKISQFKFSDFLETVQWCGWQND